MTFDDQARELHAHNRGKIATTLKVPLETKLDLSLAYTPGVGRISSDIAGDVSLAKKYTNIGNTVAIVTDGSAVLGLGNIGPAAAMPVMEGKAALFKRFADIDAVPLCLDTQDTDQIIEVVAALAPSFAGINLEDIAAPRCFEIEAKLRARLSIPVFHDDQHGTATVVLAGLINALKLRDITFADARIVINGAGAAGIAIAELLWDAGMHHITVLDSKGALSLSRTDLTTEKRCIAEKTQAPAQTLSEAMVGTEVFIGVSIANVLTKEMIQTMADRPIVFAMANPVPEIHPDDAHAAGVYIMATGRSDFPNQINNALAFPGLFRGALDSGTREITHDHLIKAAHAIAGLVAEPTPTAIIPDIFDPRLVPVVASFLPRQYGRISLMIRTTLGIVVLCAAVLWAPLWVQVVLFGISIFSVRYRVFLLIPALFADALYAPSSGFSVGMFQVTSIVAGVLLIYWLVTTQTRVTELYVSKK